MMGRLPLPAAIRNGRVIAIGRGLDPTVVVDIGQALVAGGVHAFEVTLNSDGALGAIAALRARFGADELLVGAGTVLDIAGVDAALAAGAQFIVTPVVDLLVVARTVEAGVAIVPGGFGPTEIKAAWDAGASAVKLFPASVVGPSFVRELHGPLPEIPLIPTGGLTVDAAAAWIEAGAVALGIGSWLTGPADPVIVEERARLLVAAIASVGRAAHG
jgi:2-dehydro-3-deoxyphosphogluconate aldolase / (4S)-4-hydroxy-2-oxoglutarate aldolase